MVDAARLRGRLGDCGKDVTLVAGLAAAFAAALLVMPVLVPGVAEPALVLDAALVVGPVVALAVEPAVALVVLDLDAGRTDDDIGDERIGIRLSRASGKSSRVARIRDDGGKQVSNGWRMPRVEIRVPYLATEPN